MTDATTWSRRRMLLAGVALTGGFAGCARSVDDGSTPTQTPGGEPASGDDLDLREANVVDVHVERADGTVSFDVSLHHDDGGDDGYANWWQVESIVGDQLGRRDLAHPHSTQPFTRSDTFDFPTERTCVVVRGHDQTHGYGGQAMLVNLGTGVTRAVEQGTTAQSFTDADCP